MNNVTKVNIKAKLDEIDECAVKIITGGYYQACLIKELAIWDKGEAVDTFFRVNGGVKTPTYYQAEKITGRDHKNLKSWHEIYLNCPDRKVYEEEIAKPKALAWTQKAAPKFFNPPPPKECEGPKVESDNLLLYPKEDEHLDPIDLNIGETEIIREVTARVEAALARATIGGASGDHGYKFWDGGLEVTFKFIHKGESK